MDSSRDIVRKLRENRLLNERKDYDNMSTEELIKLSKDGDQFAFQVLLEKHDDFLWRMTKKYIPEGTFDREDIRQTAEIAFWEAVNKWDMTGDFEAYAGMVIKRRMADELRKLDTDKAVANRNTKSIDGAEEGSDDSEGAGEMNKSEFDSWISNSHKSAEDEFMDQEFKDQMREFFTNEMTDVERKLIRMYLDGYKMSHIAEVTGLKYKACENAVRRAKNKIKDYFTNMRESRKIREGKDSIFSEEESRFLKDILDDIDGVNESKKMNESSVKSNRSILQLLNPTMAGDTIELLSKRYQPDAMSLEDLTDDTVDEIVAYLKKKYENELEKYGEDAEIPSEAYDVFGLDESKKMNESVGTWSDPESVGGERAIYYEVEGDDLGSVYSFDNDGDWGYTAYVYKDKEGNRIKKVSKSFRGNGSKESAKKWVEDTINESKKINEMKQEFRVEIYEPGSDECIKIKHFSDKKSADKYADQVNADGEYIALVEYSARDSREMNESDDSRTSVDIRGLARVDQEELLNDYAGAVEYKDGVIHADETTIRQIKNDYDLWESKKMNESEDPSSQVYDAIMDLGIEYESISEEDGVVYVEREKPFSHQELNKIWYTLKSATSSGFEDKNKTMWFAF